MTDNRAVERLIAKTINETAHGDPEALAARIIAALTDAGFHIRPRTSLAPPFADAILQQIRQTAKSEAHNHALELHTALVPLPSSPPVLPQLGGEQSSTMRTKLPASAHTPHTSAHRHASHTHGNYALSVLSDVFSFSGGGILAVVFLRECRHFLEATLLSRARKEITIKGGDITVKIKGSSDIDAAIRAFEEASSKDGAVSAEAVSTHAHADKKNSPKRLAARRVQKS